MCWPRSRRRRDATLVACGVPPDEVVLAVTVEVVRLLPADFARMGRYEPGGTVATVAAPARTDEHFPSAAGWPLGGRTSAGSSRRPAARRGWTALPMPPARAALPPGRRASLRRHAQTPGQRLTGDIRMRFHDALPGAKLASGSVASWPPVIHVCGQPGWLNSG